MSGWALRTLYDAFRLRLGGETELEVVPPRVAYRTGLIAPASNPMTILTWAAVFSGAAVADVAGSAPLTVTFVVGIGVGSLLVHLILAAVTSALGSRLGARALRVIDTVPGLGLIAFGGLLAARTVTSER